MDEQQLAATFEEHRTRLRAVAYRMLGSVNDADDAVQEAWLRLHRSDATAIDNLSGWLTTVVSRVCLDQLRARASRRETAYDDEPALADERASGPGPEAEAELADSVGAAMLVVLDTLGPAERLAFVLHDLFGLPFEEVAAVLDRTPAAARQLASRARRRVRGGDALERDRVRQRAVVEAFLEASRNGDFTALLELLDPDAVVRADAAAVAMGSAVLVSGRDAVAQTFSGRAQGAVATYVDGVPGAAWSMGGRPKVVFDFTVFDGRVVAIDMVADPQTIDALDLVPV